MKTHILATAVLAAFLSSAALHSTAHAANKPAATSSVAWVEASTVADVQRAQATAKTQGKPVFLYWGAVWCPPCNQVKATLFNRPDFASLSKSFVMVRVDGDKPSAQQVAKQFKVSGYPSMLVLAADGAEVTRLPGEVDPERYIATMGLALTSATPVPALIRSARVGGSLSDAQWQQLAWYAWDIDEQQAAGGKAEMLAALDALALSAPAGAVKDRLQMRAWIAASQDSKRNGEAAWQSTVRGGMSALFAAPTRANALPDLWMGHADTLVKAAAPQPGADRDALAIAADKQLAAMIAGGKLSRAETLDAWAARLSVMALHSAGDLALRAQAIAASQAVAANTPDKYERQAVIPTAAHVIGKAGDLAAADAMLTAELPKAVAPYYHMLVLGSNAKKRKDNKAALDWYGKAWTQSQGIATRAQWGNSYVSNLIELSPDDAKSVEKAAAQILKETLRPEALYARTARSIQRMATKVQTWAGEDPKARAPVATRLQTAATAQCKAMPAKSEAKVACEGLKFLPV
jgi:thioredoxin-related protein